MPPLRLGDKVLIGLAIWAPLLAYGLHFRVLRRGRDTPMGQGRVAAIVGLMLGAYALSAAAGLAPPLPARGGPPTVLEEALMGWIFVSTSTIALLASRRRAG